MFDIFNETDEKIDELEFINDYVNFICNKEKLDNCIFNIIFIDNEKIREINREYRNIDRETDVISFALEDNNDIKYDGFRVLGDIYISLEKAKEQAMLYEHSYKREICFLITHGILHLLGYDHMEEDEEKIMFDKQERLLEEYEIKR